MCKSSVYRVGWDHPVYGAVGFSFYCGLWGAWLELAFASIGGFFGAVVATVCYPGQRVF